MLCLLIKSSNLCDNSVISGENILQWNLSGGLDIEKNNLIFIDICFEITQCFVVQVYCWFVFYSVFILKINCLTSAETDKYLMYLKMSFSKAQSMFLVCVQSYI